MDPTDNQLRACVAALTNTIGPAMDPRDRQAAEQLFMVTDYLGYLRTRLDHLHDRQRFEVRHHLAVADAIAADAAALVPAEATALDEAAAPARSALADPAARTPELREHAARLASAVTEVLRAAGSLEDERRVHLEREVVRLSEDKIVVDRAWHLPQGLGGDPGSVLPLDEALGLT